MIRFIRAFFFLILFQNFCFASQENEKDYFDLLDAELGNVYNNKVKVNKIIERETIKYNKTGNKKYLLSSKYAELFLYPVNDTELISKNYEILELNKNEFTYITLRTQFNLSNLFINDPEKALFFIDNAIVEAKKKGYTDYLAYFYDMKGRIFYRKEDYRSSKLFNLLALKYFQKNKDTTGISSIYNSMGNIYYAQKKFLQADQEYQKAKRIIESKKSLLIEDYFSFYSIKRSMGKNYSKLGNFENAEKNLVETFDYYKTKPQEEIFMVQTIKDLYELYTDFSYNDKIDHLVKEIKNVENKITLTKNKLIISELLLEYYFKVNNKAECQNYIQKLIKLNLQNEKELNEQNRKIAAILNQKILNDIDSKHKDEIKNQKTLYFWLTITSFLIAAIFVILFLFIRDRRNRDKKLFENQIQIDQQRKLILEQDLQIREERIKNLQLNLSLKSQTEKSFLTRLKSMRKTQNNVDDILNELYFNLHNLLEIDKKNENFSQDNIYQNKEFIERLNAKFPMLSNKELQFCVYFRLNLTSKEIAILEKTSNGSVRVLKSRIKTKIGLEKEENLDEYLRML